MPELSIEIRQWCATNEFWETQVPGSSGSSYTVTFSNYGHKSDTVMGYSCTCQAFKFGKSGTCKHIKEAKKRHCQWNQEVCWGDGVTPVGHTCPKCGGPLASVKIGV